MDTPAMIITTASMRKIVPKMLLCRRTPSIRMAMTEQRRQGMPTTNAKALGNGAVNSSDNQMMIEEKRTMAQTRWRKETKLPKTNMPLLMVDAIAVFNSLSTRMREINTNIWYMP